MKFIIPGLKIRVTLTLEDYLNAEELPKEGSFCLFDIIWNFNQISPFIQAHICNFYLLLEWPDRKIKILSLEEVVEEILGDMSKKEKE